jgi:putative tryptophan/tyrosine transport system substrate-binding protein
MRDGLGERGYVEGQNFTIDFRSPAISFEHDREVAVDLVRSGVDLIVAWTTPSVMAARRATSTVPIVMVGVADAVGLGLVASLARPGGNVTGTTNMSSDLAGKMVELLQEIAPGTGRIGVVRNPSNVGVVLQFRQIENALRAVGLPFEVVDAGTPSEFERAFAHLSAKGIASVVLLADPSLVEHANRIAELAQRAGLATVFQRRESVDAGGLVSYGPNLNDQFRRVAGHVDRILKGTKPADLPVEQPTKFELIINLKMAKMLGLTIPPALLARADEVIE